MFTVYRALASLAVPLFLVPLEAAAVALGGEPRDRLAQRLGRKSAPPPGRSRRALIHAVSVGEMAAATALVHALTRDQPDLGIVLSAGNRDGLAAASKLARQHDAVEAALLLPWDRPRALERWLAALHPTLVVVVETEIWPGLFLACARRRVPLCIVNGRIYPADLGRYRLFRRFFGRILERAAWIGVQDDAERRRFEAVGAPSDRVEVVGNLKYDVPVHAPATGVDRPMRDRVLLAASTHAPEECRVLDAFTRLRADLPDLGCVIAPRKVRRASGIVEAARARFLEAEPWSRSTTAAPDVWVVDEMGLLPSLFGRAEVVFVGGSLAPRGGHNLLEPAAHGRAILVGPHVDHFRGIVAAFDEGNALVRLGSSDDLYPQLRRLLSDESRRRTLGHRAHEVYEAGRGSARIYARKLRDVMARGAT